MHSCVVRYFVPVISLKSYNWFKQIILSHALSWLASLSPPSVAVHKIAHAYIYIVFFIFYHASVCVCVWVSYHSSRLVQVFPEAVAEVQPDKTEDCHQVKRQAIVHLLRCLQVEVELSLERFVNQSPEHVEVHNRLVFDLCLDLYQRDEWRPRLW